MCVHVCVYRHTHVCRCVCMYTRVCMCNVVHVYVYMCVACIFVCMHMCVCACTRMHLICAVYICLPIDMLVILTTPDSDICALDCVLYELATLKHAVSYSLT